MMNKRKSGRTTRMLKHAINMACDGQTLIIAVNDVSHLKALDRQLEELAKASGIPKLKRKRGRDVLRKRVYIVPFANLHHFDWATGDARRGNNTTVLIDHYALESRLGIVREYLNNFKGVDDPIPWMAQTARILSSLGRAMYLVSDDVATRERLEGLVEYRHAGVEDGEGLGLDWLNLRSRSGMHPNCQLLFDPATVERRFSGALKLINWWDA